jgi:hypothetical protein
MRTSPDTGMCHIGFRCVMTAEMWAEKLAAKNGDE